MKINVIAVYRIICFIVIATGKVHFIYKLAFFVIKCISCLN